MISLGIDPSSSVCGVALAYRGEDDEPRALKIDSFFAKSVDKIDHDGLAQNMEDFRNFVNRFVKPSRPDVVVIEQVHVQHNVNTVRKIAYFEAVGILCANWWGADLFMVQATKARRIVLSKGTLSKENAELEVRARWPNLGWKPKGKPGADDETDAWCLACAGRQLMIEAGRL